MEELLNNRGLYVHNYSWYTLYYNIYTLNTNELLIESRIAISLKLPNGYG